MTWPTVAAHEIHLADHHCHDLHRGDRKRGAEEERGDQALAWVGQHGVGQGFAERNPADEGNDDAGKRGDGRGAAGLAHQLEIGFHAGEKQQQQNAELRDGVEHRLLLFCGGKDRVLQSGASAPSREGPSTRPAINWPITPGCLIRIMASPSSRPTSISTTSCAKNTNSDGLCSLSAAKAGVASSVGLKASAAAAPRRRASDGRT